MERCKVFWALLIISIIYVIILPSGIFALAWQWSTKTSTPLSGLADYPGTSPPVLTTQIPTLTPTTTAQDSDSVVFDTVQTYLLNAVNEYRRSVGLSPVNPDKNTCDFAKSRAKEITSEFNHKEFQNRISTKSLPYPSYFYVTENIAMDSHFQNVIAIWKNSPGHAANMRADTPYACIANIGNYYAYEGWKP